MEFLEKDLEGIIYEAYKKDASSLRGKGLNISGTIKRQLRIGNYGVADLVTFEKTKHIEYAPERTVYDYEEETVLYEELNWHKAIITVYELKKDKIGISAYLQAMKYVSGIKHYFNEKGTGFQLEFKIVLIGKDIDTSGSFCFIPDFDKNVEFYTYKYGLYGLEFNNEFGYQIDSNFKL